MLGDAIGAEDWPRALGLALEAWRATRSWELADPIDVLTTRCPRLVENHAQWIAAAATYDAVIAGSLTHHAHANASRCSTEWHVMERRFAGDPVLARIFPPRHGVEPPRFQRNRIERLCAFARWPPDPRVATVLARWFVHDLFAWQYPYEHDAATVREILAEELVRIGDVRIAPALTELCERRVPIGNHDEIAHQRLARRVLARLPAPEPGGAEVRTWIAKLAPPRRDIEALWADVFANPDAIGPRLVLADVLQQHGDPRGELFALQCANPPRNGARLLAAHRAAWLGELAAIVEPKYSTFARGMLSVACLGRVGAPAAAYATCIGHRELAIADTVQQRYITPEQLAPLLAGMHATRPRALTKIRMGSLHVLAAARPRLPIRVLTLRGRCSSQELAQDLRLLPSLCPELERIVFETALPALDLAELIALRRLPSLVHARAAVEPGAFGELLDVLAREVPQLVVEPA